MAARGGRNAMAKLESRIRELEIELGNTQSRTSETYKAYQKSERRIKELQFQSDEDRKNQVCVLLESLSAFNLLLFLRRECLSSPPSCNRRSRPTRSR